MKILPETLGYQDASQLEALLTSHGIGRKKIFIKELPEKLQIKQIALGYLSPGEAIEPHVHPDLDEYYYVLEGNGSIHLNDAVLPFHKDIFVRVSAGTTHSLTCEQHLTFFYFGVELLEHPPVL